MIKKIYLVGNPNVGKSVVFSRLTGVHVISSNYPGTTVEVSTGFLKVEDERLEVVDLPGTYSLEADSPAERAATSSLVKSNRDEMVVINVVDATNLERNLFLTLQLIESGYPVVVCLNMYDEAAHHGVQLNTVLLEKLLGVPVIPTCAVTGSGVKVLVSRIKEAKASPLKAISHEARWLEIGGIVAKAQKLFHRHHTFRETLEDISVKPLSGLVMSIFVVYASFKIVRFLGEGIITYISDPVFNKLYLPFLEKISLILGQAGFWHHLFIGELLKGKIDFKQSMGVLTTAPYIEFGMVLPYVISFYFILSLLEDIGYLPRLAILLDNVLHRLGLHGFAIIPVLLGFGCNVPGILSTRVLESKRERFIASTLISIGVPCVPLQAMIFGLLGGFGGWYVGGVYAVLGAVLLILGFVLNRLLKGYSPELLLEIPPYRIPPIMLVVKKLFFRIKGFLWEALPVVLGGVLLINVLMYFKLFDALTKVTEPVVTGVFGLPKEATVALVIGFLRKDIAVGLLMPLALTVKQLFIAAVLLAMSFPCIATFVVLWKELGFGYLIKATLLMIGVSFIVGALLNFGIKI